MSFMFTVSPDFTPDHLPGWYFFNSWLQKQTNLAIHLEIYNDFKSQREAIQSDSIDLIYANPFDAAMLVREKGFQPLVKAFGEADEVMIVTSVNNSVEEVVQLEKGIKIAFTEDPSVYMIGKILIEPGGLSETDINPLLSDTYVLVAKWLLKGEADVGFFLAEAFDSLSPLIKKQLKILVRSQIDVIHHSLMMGPKLLNNKTVIQKELVEMNGSEKGQGVLNSLGFNGWSEINENEMEFMIDLMDTLIT